MRTCALIIYTDDESIFTPYAGAYYDKYGIIKNVEQVLKENNYQGKIDILPETQATTYIIVKDPITATFQKMTDAEKAYFAGFSFPFLAFYDVQENRTFGILAKKDATKYNAVKSALDVIANTKEFIEGKGYKIEFGNTTYFLQDAKDAHLNPSSDGVTPKHSLLDLVYLGGNLGFLDRPYVRDFITSIIDGFKKYGFLIALGAGAAVYVIFNKRKKKKNKISGLRRKTTPSVKGLKKKKAGT